MLDAEHLRLALPRRRVSGAIQHKSWRDSVNQRRRPLGRVVIVGETLCSNEWLSATLDENSYSVSRCPDLSDIARVELDDGAAILLDGSTAARTSSLALLRRSSPNERRRTVLVGWSLDVRVIREFIAFGVSDFPHLPASTSALRMRLELRLRALDEPEGASHSAHVVAPHADPLTGVIGSPLLGVRLSERELMLYNFFIERFGQAIPRDEILRFVWQRDESAVATSNIVDVYVRYLRVKLARAAPHLALVTIRNVGYSLRSIGSSAAEG